MGVKNLQCHDFSNIKDIYWFIILHWLNDIQSFTELADVPDGTIRKLTQEACLKHGIPYNSETELSLINLVGP